MLQESAASSSVKEQKSSKWWFHTPKESSRAWVVVPDSGCGAIASLSSAAVRLGGAGGASIKGLLRESSLLSGADAVDTIGQQVCDGPRRCTARLNRPYFPPQAGMFDGIFREGGYLEIFGVEEAGFRWGHIDRELMLNQALLEGNDVRSMVSQQQVLDNVFSPLFLAKRVSADRLLPVVVENIRSPFVGLCAALHTCVFTRTQVNRQIQSPRRRRSARVPGAPLFGLLAPALHHAALPHSVPRD